MSNYLDFAPWAATASSGGGQVIQVREDNKTAQVPYKLFGGQTKSFHVLSPAGTIIEYSENGTDWEYLTVGKQDRFFDATDGLYLNGTILNNYIEGGLQDVVGSTGLPSAPGGDTVLRGVTFDNKDNLVAFHANTSFLSVGYVWNSELNMWVLGNNGYDDFPGSLQFYASPSFCIDRETEDFVACNPDGSTVAYFKNKDTSFANNPINSAGTFNIGAFTIHGGDLFILDLTSSTVKRFDGRTDTVLASVDVSAITPTSFMGLGFDLNGNMVIAKSGGNFFVFEGFSDTLLYTSHTFATMDPESGYGFDMAIHPKTGDIVVLCRSSSVINFVQTESSSTVTEPAVLLSEST